jgi:hypothetical protein
MTEDGNTIEFEARMVTETVFLGNRLARVVFQRIDNWEPLRRINRTKDGARVRFTIEYLEEKK